MNHSTSSSLKWLLFRNYHKKVPFQWKSIFIVHPHSNWMTMNYLTASSSEYIVWIDNVEEVLYLEEKFNEFRDNNYIPFVSKSWLSLKMYFCY